MYNGNTIMPFGVYKGKKLANVPGSWLLWLWNDSGEGKGLKDRFLAHYIKENLEAIKSEGNKNEKR